MSFPSLHFLLVHIERPLDKHVEEFTASYLIHKFVHGSQAHTFLVIVESAATPSCPAIWILP